MRFVQPKKGGGSGKTPGISPFRPKSQPDWLKEWIENQGHYVELSCGCMEDVKARGILVVYKALKEKFKEVEVFCERCDKWVWLSRSVSLNEYLGIPKVQLPETPLF